MPAITNVFFNARDVDASVNDVPEPPAPWTLANIPGWVGYLALAVAIIFMVVLLIGVVYYAHKYSAKWLRQVPEHKPSQTLSASEIRRLKLGKPPRETIVPPPRAHMGADDALYRATRTNTLKNQRPTAQAQAPEIPGMRATPLPPILRPVGARW
ncbi:hypothetical protein C8R46DRAFT_1032756 [Mycena filopes]|nr:hypothetical protein C8R46DRAFT_1032756 [Mycena filopes]